MPKTFGQIIKEARKEKDISQRKLAELTGYNFTYISKLENDKNDTPPSLELIDKFAAHLDIKKLDLLYTSGRIPAEIKLIYAELLKKYGDRITNLLRKMYQDPVFAKNILNQLNNDETDINI